MTRPLREILEHPPTKLVICKRCNGSTIVNRRGLISSDACPDCGRTRGSRHRGKVYTVDYAAMELEIHNALRKGN